MEEVWKDINLASLKDQPTTPTITTTTANPRPTFPHTILQDFFVAKPFDTNPPTKSGIASSTEPSSSDSIVRRGGSILTLNFGSESQWDNHSTLCGRSPAFGSSLDSSFDSLGSYPNFEKRPQLENVCVSNYNDRNYKRMIKNRESAARSRARKQAYTSELELEVAHLVRENARLRKQVKKMMLAGRQYPKKYSLSRTSTAPF